MFGRFIYRLNIGRLVCTSYVCSMTCIWVIFWFVIYCGWYLSITIGIVVSYFIGSISVVFCFSTVFFVVTFFSVVIASCIFISFYLTLVCGELSSLVIVALVDSFHTVTPFVTINFVIVVNISTFVIVFGVIGLTDLYVNKWLTSTLIYILVVIVDITEAVTDTTNNSVSFNAAATWFSACCWIWPRLLLMCSWRMPPLVLIWSRKTARSVLT